MEDAPAAAPSDATTHLDRAFSTLLTGWRAGARLLDERLTDPAITEIPISGATRVAVATDRHGAPVVIAAIPSMSTDTIIDLARLLASLEREHSHTGRGGAGRVHVVCEHPPTGRVWNALVAQFGLRLGGVYLARRVGLKTLSPPSNWRRIYLRVRPEWTVTEWAAAAGVVLGLVLTALGIRGLLL